MGLRWIIRRDRPAADSLSPMEDLKKSLRNEFLTADAGLTGVNFGIAETGEFVICTNEGNADMSTSIPKLHIAAMGIEKVIPDLRSLAVFHRLLARSATGQPATNFTSHFKRPRKGCEMHLILVGGHPVVLGEGEDIPSECSAPDNTIVQGVFGVAENGCVWIPQTMDDRSVLFTPERLIIILDRNDIISNMHEAYSRLSGTDYDYGCFICGPSKTADIAQALVMGAQAARDLVVYIR